VITGCHRFLVFVKTKRYIDVVGYEKGAESPAYTVYEMPEAMFLQIVLPALLWQAAIRLVCL
jgi:hypothetical protein